MITDGWSMNIQIIQRGYWEIPRAEQNRRVALPWEFFHFLCFVFICCGRHVGNIQLLISRDKTVPVFYYELVNINIKHIFGWKKNQTYRPHFHLSSWKEKIQLSCCHMYRVAILRAQSIIFWTHPWFICHIIHKVLLSSGRLCTYSETWFTSYKVPYFVVFLSCII